MTTELIAFVYWTLRKYTHVGMFQYDLMTKLGQISVSQSATIQGGIRDARPLLVQILLFLCILWQNFAK